MGALRAAELHVLGMVGVGRIFEDYRCGRLEDDDEVAVAHGPAETGFLAVSEAMVNIRYTLAAALDAAVIVPSLEQQLARLAKATFFKTRAWTSILRDARRLGEHADCLDAFSAWLPTGAIDQKRLDAIAALHHMRRFLETDPPPHRPAFSLARTPYFLAALRRAGAGDFVPAA
jgi:hypothetical protein